MALLMSIVAISIDALLPALGIISTELNLSNPNHAQYLIGFVFVGMAIGQLISGPLSDAWGRKKILYIGIGFYTVGSIICFIAPTLEMILLGRFIQGLGVSGPYVCAISIVRDKFSGRHMASVMSIIMMIFIMVPAIAPALGQFIIIYFSWRSIFVFYIIYSLIVGTWLFLRLEETLPKSNRIPFNSKNLLHGLKEILNCRVTVGYTACIGIIFGSFVGYLNSSQQIFQSQFNTGSLFTVYFGGLALVFGVSSFVNSRFVEKFGMLYLCIRSLLLIIFASLMFLTIHLVVPVTLWMFVVYAAVVFFGFGLLFGNLNAIAMEPMGHIAGIASAIIGSSSSVISMILGAIIGQLYNGTVIPVVAGFATLGSVALLIITYIQHHKSKNDPVIDQL